MCVLAVEPCLLHVAGPRQAAAIASVSVLATLLAITLVWGVVILVRHRRRQRYPTLCCFAHPCLLQGHTYYNWETAVLSIPLLIAVRGLHTHKYTLKCGLWFRLV